MRLLAPPAADRMGPTLHVWSCPGPRWPLESGATKSWTSKPTRDSRGYIGGQWRRRRCGREKADLQVRRRAVIGRLGRMGRVQPYQAANLSPSLSRCLWRGLFGEGGGGWGRVAARERGPLGRPECDSTSRHGGALRGSLPSSSDRRRDGYVAIDGESRRGRVKLGRRMTTPPQGPVGQRQRGDLFGLGTLGTRGPTTDMTPKKGPIAN